MLGLPDEIPLRLGAPWLRMDDQTWCLRMNESRLAKVLYRVAKMLVSLLEEEFGLRSKKTE